MSAKGVAFRIDVILQSVNELRQEKQALEQKYAEEMYRSKNLEMKLEQERMKFCQSRDRNSKMQETVKLAQQKVAQTDSQADRLNEINDAKQKVIVDLNKKIKLESGKQESDVTEFQLKLSELTQYFREAKRAYAKDNLTKETKEWKENMDAVINEADSKSIELEDIAKAFENLSIDTSKIKECIGEKMGRKGVPFKELKVTIDHLTRKQEQLQTFLSWLECCENKAKAEIQEYDRSRIASGQERRNRMVETEIANQIVKNITPAETQVTGVYASGVSENHPISQNYIQPVHDAGQSLTNKPTVPNQTTQGANHVAQVNISECVNTVDHVARNQHAVINQSTTSVICDQESRNQSLNQSTQAATRVAQARIPSVNSPSFFISLPCGRTR